MGAVIQEKTVNGAEHLPEEISSRVSDPSQDPTPSQAAKQDQQCQGSKTGRVPLKQKSQKSNVIEAKNKQSEPVVVNCNKSQINKEASDFGEVSSDWPTLVEVHQAQEALQLNQVQKANWRKDEKSRKEADESAKQKNGSSEGEVEQEEDSGSHDDDSLKENREAGGSQANKQEPQNSQNLKNAKNKKNKTKKQSWKRLDIVPPRRDKFRRDGRSLDSNDWRADMGRGRGSSRGRGVNYVRGRGRGRGSAPVPAASSRPSSVGDGSCANGSSFESVQDYSGVPLVPYFMPGLPAGFVYDFPEQPQDEKSLIERLQTQVEYYFSTPNLMRDIFMRRKMDDEGFMPILLIASFNRMKAISNDFDLIVKACKESTELEVKDDLWVRTIHFPNKWPLRDGEVVVCPQAVAMPPTISIPPNLSLSRPPPRRHLSLHYEPRSA